MQPTKNECQVLIDIEIKDVKMKVPEKVDIIVLWKRSNKKIDTKVSQLCPSNSHAIFNESFQMKTQLEWIPHKKYFKKKRSDF